MAFSRRLRPAVGQRVLGRGRAMIVAVMVAGAVAVVGISQAMAGVTTTVASSSGEAPLPSGAATNGQAAYLGSVSCAKVTSCFAVGSYVDATTGTQAMITHVGQDTAGATHKIKLPSGAAAGGQNAALLSVSCTAATSCVGVGYYNDASGARQAMVVPLISGALHAATKVALPSGAAAGGQVAELLSVSCPSTGSCSAVGYYSAGSTGRQAMMVPITSGVPRTAQEVSLPAGAAVSQNALLNSVSCVSTSSCFAVGYYQDATTGQQAMVAPITGGALGSAQEVSLPSGAATSGQNAALNAVSCASAGSCAAVGDYMDASSDQQAMMAPITGGVPGTGQEAILPSGAATSGQRATLDSVSCAIASMCTAVGSYTDATTGGQTFVAPITRGVLGSTQEVTLPSDATSTNQNSALYSVSCESASSCAAVGLYSDTIGNIQAQVTAVQRRLAIANTTLPPARLGGSYHAVLRAFGGIGIHRWSIAAGRLPQGLRLNTVTGAISGTPKVRGVFKLKVRAFDPGPPAQTVMRVLALRVSQALVKIPHGALRVQSNRAIAPLNCPGAPCRGTVVLIMTTGTRGSYAPVRSTPTWNRINNTAGLGTAARSRLTSIGEHRFRIQPGRTARVRVRLNHAALTALRSATGHRIKVLEVVIVKSGPNRKVIKTLR